MVQMRSPYRSPGGSPEEEFLLVRSRQSWRLTLALWWLPVSGAAIVFGTLLGFLGRSPEQKAGLVAFGVTVWIGGYVWAAITVRCSKCGARLLWKAMRERTASDWTDWLLSLKRCPVCANDPIRHD